MNDHLQNEEKVTEFAFKRETYDLAIIGGGLAGIAAAMEARKKRPGWRIALVESRRRLGGRAGSFIDPKTGAWIDNCQHVGLGCCPELIDFVAELGVSAAFRRAESLLFLSPDGHVDSISASRFLPPPLHLAIAFARVQFLSFKDKLLLGYGLLKLVATPSSWLSGVSVADWLNRNYQTRNAIQSLWEPVLVSALNDDLDKLDSAGARKVFLESFFKKRDGFHLLVPAMPLGLLFDEHVRAFFNKNQIEIIEGEPANAIRLQKDIFEIEFQKGQKIKSHQLILATPWQSAGRLLESMNDQRITNTIQSISSLETSPITGVHLVIDRNVCPYNEIALLGRTSQWVFDHTTIDRQYHPEMIPENGQSLHVVISASHRLSKLKRESILEIIVDELKMAFPEMQSAHVLSSWVVTEHAATFSPSPESVTIRPDQKTAIPGLALAGDWTRTGWPSTMEGAIRSGRLAARVLKSELK
jgi:squalene-associated FAD-dependent desaturase